MANPTTNYGWPMPTSTDLVTDLPADFALFGQPVDTSLKALNPETTLGDIAYRSSTSDTNTRLGIGTSGQVLAVSGGGVPAWTTTADVTPLTTKGDLFTFSTVDARLGVGSNNQILVADSAEATGLKWATPSSGAMTLITRATFTSVANTGTTFDGVFTSTYKTYLAVFEFVSAATYADDFQIQLRYAGPNTQAATYYGTTVFATHTGGPTNLPSNNTAQFTLANETEGSGDLYFNKVGNSSEVAAMYGTGVNLAGYGPQLWGCKQDTARTYTGFLLKSSSSNITGTVAVYGLATS